MPVLQISALPQPDPDRIGPALRATCKAIAEAYGCPARQVWATWTTIEPGLYVEGDLAVGIQPKDSHPPIGRLLCFEGKNAETIARTLEAAAAALSQELGIPGNIFIEYAEARSGCVIAGDGVIRR